MVDHVSHEKRAEIMRSVKTSGSSAELVVRKAVWALGFRYRLNVKTLPGSPDLAFAGRRKAIFVHGCFWHGHCDCSKARLPNSNRDYWQKKIEANKVRDLKASRDLTDRGWSVLTIWQCQLKDAAQLQETLKNFLDLP
ncbi:very short patch repair endonuclease [Burkholderia cepacia]|uniref:very short patch repair endonuclease n=1 Tax=Burkholderia cepacia TaxID=292 RepID=UPI003EE16EDE